MHIINTAGVGGAFMFDTNGDPVTSGTAVCTLIQDNGTPVSATNTPVHKTDGFWTVDLTAAERNFQQVQGIITVVGAINGAFEHNMTDPADIASAVLDALLVNHIGTGSIGEVFAAIFNQTDPANLRAALGLATSNLDSQIAGVNTNIDGNESKIDSVLSALSTAAVDITEILLDYDLGTGPDTNAYTVRNGMRFLQNGWAVVGSTYTVKQEDGITDAFTATLTFDGNGNVTGFDRT